MAAPDRSQEPRPSEGSWLLRLYEMISIAPEDIAADAKGLGIQIADAAELATVKTAALDDLAAQYIRNAKLMTSLSGAGLGAGGILFVGPELSILAASLLRLAQRIAVVYGFDYKKPEEALHVWTALARALGVDKITDGNSVVAVRSLPKLLAVGPGRSSAFKSLIKMIAARLGLLVTERSLARALPLVGAGVAAVTNYQLVRDLGGKIQGYFRERHIHRQAGRADAAEGAAAAKRPAPRTKPASPASTSTSHAARTAAPRPNARAKAARAATRSRTARGR